jgi:uncharacterized SAM-binding protein YcdF (DUF218 family)
MKKLLGTMLSPLSLILLLQLTAVVCLLIKRPRYAVAFGLLGFGGLFLSSHEATADWLILRLESQHPPAPLGPAENLPAELRNCRYIAVHGGGHNQNTSHPALNRLGASSRARLVEAVRLARLLPEATLLMCGPVGRETPESHASVLTAAAIELGIPAERCKQLTNVRDTFDEVHAIKEVVGDAPVALVTSAWHMPRAHGIAEKANLNHVPCPSDYQIAPGGNPDSAWRKWSSAGIERTSRATREFLGLTWTWMRGQR